jgi:2-aminophenol/2-amino-5-chlorophenol 1,6-dioxygenase alpha subunit
MGSLGGKVMSGEFVGGFIAPGKPHILLAPEKNENWQSMHDSFARARQEIEALKPDLLLLYSTQWASIIGHQIQADPAPTWKLVDQDFHALGTMEYTLRMDPVFAEAYCKAAKARGLTARTVAYRGFPVDTGTVVALSLLDPERKTPACVVSCNMYADRAETIILAKAAQDAVKQSGKRVVAVAVTALSNRMWTDWIDPVDDRIHSAKDDEWNRKLLELLEEGRLEDVSQLARQFTSQAHGDNKLKAIWWLSACLGQTNNFSGTIYDYQPVWGTGAALVGLLPEASSTLKLEYDEDNTEHYKGDRNVLSS